MSVGEIILVVIALGVPSYWIAAWILAPRDYPAVALLDDPYPASLLGRGRPAREKGGGAAVRGRASHTQTEAIARSHGKRLTP